MFDFGFLDAIFSDDGKGASSTQGGPRLNQGFAPVAGWMVGQAFADAGPVGQYLGLLYGSPGTGIPSVRWASYVDHGDYIDFTVGDAYAYSNSASHQVANASDSAPAQPAGSQTLEAPSQPDQAPRTLEVLDRGDSGSSRPNEQIDVVNVFGTPRARPSSSDWWPGLEKYLSPQRDGTFSGAEIQIRWVDPPSIRPPRSRASTVRRPSPADPVMVAPEQPRPERDPVDSSPSFSDRVDGLPSFNSDHVSYPSWMTDASVPEQFLPLGSLKRPENVPSPRLERGDTGRIETIPTVPIERSFWNRGGTGLALGAGTAAAGLVVLFWWNPVGWAAGASLALMIAGGVAATTASAVELSASYSGSTSPEQDAQMNRAISATLEYTSSGVGGVIGGAIGPVFAADAQEGFEAGTLWGGLFEGAISLPGALRALPGLWRAGRPWAKSLLLTPFWFFQSTGTGGGNVRSLARVFTAQGRLAARVRSVEYLGTTPLLERDANWARYQVFATGTRQEGIYRITYANGQQRIALADRGVQGGRSILEAKEGNLGQMFIPEREAHIIRQANNYIDITTATGGTAGYRVSTELGASRLAQRFRLEFPAQMASGQLWIKWVPWGR